MAESLLLLCGFKASGTGVFEAFKLVQLNNLDFESSSREVLQTTGQTKREPHSTDPEVLEKAQCNLEQVETLLERDDRVTQTGPVYATSTRALFQ